MGPQAKIMGTLLLSEEEQRTTSLGDKGTASKRGETSPLGGAAESTASLPGGRS